MKRFCLFFLIVCVGVLCVGCNFEKKFNRSISECHTHLFSADDENFFVTLSLGQREEPYIVDGKNEKMVSFAVLTAYKANNKLEKHTAKFTLMTDSAKYDGDFEINPFDNSFVVDLKEIVGDLANINVEITADNKTIGYKLVNQLADSDATLQEIQTIAAKELSSKKSDIMKGNKMHAEVYYRLIKRHGYKPLWYVSVFTESGELLALIIDPTTRYIIAKKL